jgi:hypothetical protein
MLRRIVFHCTSTIMILRFCSKFKDSTPTQIIKVTNGRSLLHHYSRCNLKKICCAELLLLPSLDMPSKRYYLLVFLPFRRYTYDCLRLSIITITH